MVSNAIGPLHPPSRRLGQERHSKVLWTSHRSPQHSMQRGPGIRWRYDLGYQGLRHTTSPEPTEAISESTGLMPDILVPRLNYHNIPTIEHLALPTGDVLDFVNFRNKPFFSWLKRRWCHLLKKNCIIILTKRKYLWLLDVTCAKPLIMFVTIFW